MKTKKVTFPLLEMYKCLVAEITELIPNFKNISAKNKGRDYRNFCETNWIKVVPIYQKHGFKIILTERRLTVSETYMQETIAYESENGLHQFLPGNEYDLLVRAKSIDGWDKAVIRNSNKVSVPYKEKIQAIVSARLGTYLMLNEETKRKYNGKDYTVTLFFYKKIKGVTYIVFVGNPDKTKISTDNGLCLENEYEGVEIKINGTVTAYKPYKLEYHSVYVFAVDQSDLYEVWDDKFALTKPIRLCNANEWINQFKGTYKDLKIKSLLTDKFV